MLGRVVVSRLLLVPSRVVALVCSPSQAPAGLCANVTRAGYMRVYLRPGAELYRETGVSSAAKRFPVHALSPILSRIRSLVQHSTHAFLLLVYIIHFFHFEPVNRGSLSISCTLYNPAMLTSSTLSWGISQVLIWTFGQ